MIDLLLVLALGSPLPLVEAQSQDPAAVTIETQTDRLTGPARRVADWVAVSGNNQSLPYIIVDKTAVRAFMFDAEGRPVGDVPVLIGMTVGDEATPGIGEKSLERIGPHEKTTPAGRFLARMGRAGGGTQVLWVDYANSVALHTIPPASTAVRRKAMISRSLKDNRITFGCINVPQAFFHKSVRPAFAKKGGYVYVLPETKPLEDVFPLLRLQQQVSVEPPI